MSSDQVAVAADDDDLLAPEAMSLSADHLQMAERQWQ